MSKSRFFCGGSALAVTFVLSVGVQSAMAQQQPKPPVKEEDEPTVTEVVTTGTFIRGAAEDAALPVEVTTRAEIEKQGNPTLGELVRTMSEIGNIQGEDNRNGGNAPGVTTINLRNMGSGRTLVLLNGNRLASQVSSAATNGETQDASVIPTAALQQVEVLKDGGSTTYGSDAVSGVVNFKTRTDLNGMEAAASYKYVKGSDGDYDGSILWGRRNENGNVLLTFSYAHRSELRSDQRDFMRVDPLYGAGATPGGGFFGGWTQTSNPGSYSFYGPAPTTSPAANLPVGSNATAPLIRSQLGTGGTGVLADNASNANSGTGTVRDPLCNQLGGFRGFTNVTGTNSPVCLTNFIMAENLVQDNDQYNIFGDANFNVTDKWRANFSFNFSKNVTPHRVYSGVTGQTQSGAAQSPCDPYDPFVTNSTNPTSRQCLSQSFFRDATTGATYVPPTAVPTQYYVSGYNPALQHFVYTARMDGTTGRPNGGAYYFSGAQQNAIASCLPGLTRSYIDGKPCSDFDVGSVNPGRAQLRVTGNGGSFWSPFSAQGNPAFDGLRATERNENLSFSTTASLKGELGELFGTQLDTTLTGTFTRLFIDTSGKGILIDRLQRALNGFATNLNDRSGPGGTVDRCTAGETLGVRPGAYSSTSTVSTGVVPLNPVSTSATGVITTISAGPVAGSITTTVQTPIATPYSAGAGGGWGDANGAADGTLSNTASITASNFGGLTVGGNVANGNGCYFFNPFASAVQKTNFGQTLSTNVIGGPAIYGFVGTGHYQGYGNPALMTLAGNGLYTAPAGFAGTGLQNDIGVINWLYQDRWSRIASDTVDLQARLNGTGGFDLPGGPLAWAIGGQYRYFRRAGTYDTLSDLSKNPCTFISTATGIDFASRVGVPDQNDINIPGRQQLTGTLAENYSVTCTNVNQTNQGRADTLRTGVWFDGFGGTEFYRANRTISGFGELSLPVLDNVSISLQTRYDKNWGNSGIPVDATVSSGAIKWRVNDQLTLRASGSQTFDAVDPEDPGLISTANGTGIITGTNLTTAFLDAKTRADTYGNVALSPETGFNYSFGFIFRPTPSFEFQAQLANIEVKGRPVAISATNLSRLLVGRGGVGQTITDAEFNPANQAYFNGLDGRVDCTTNGLFRTNDPSSGQPIIRLVGTDGTIVDACSAAGTGGSNNVGLYGLDISGADPDGAGPALPVGTVTPFGIQDYALLFNLPNRVNAGNQSTRQLDMSSNWRLPKTVLGGVTTVGMDISYLFFLNQDPSQYNGAVLDAGGKYRAVIAAATGSQTPSLIRGSLSANWVHGKNDFSIYERFVSSLATGSTPIVAQSTTTAFTNYNPTTANQVACTLDNISLMIPDPRVQVAALGPRGVGEGNPNPLCNIGNYTGQKNPATMITDFIYNRKMSGNSTLTVTVNNVFDLDPPYSRQTQYYYPSATVTALGRTVKVGVRKVF